MSPRWSHLSPVLPPARDDLVPGGLPSAVVPRAVQMTVVASVKEPSWASVIDWSAIDGHLPEATFVVADRHRVKVDAFRARLRAVRSQGARASFAPAVQWEGSRQSRPGEDHEARRRWAYLLHLTPPEPAPEPPPFKLGVREHRVVRTATKVLAAVGPMSLAELTVSVRQAHAASHHQPISELDLARALLLAQAAEPDHQGRWRNCKEVTPNLRHVALLDAARVSGRDSYTSAQIRELLAAAGYTSIHGPTLYHHPLLRHVGRSRWEILSPSP